MGKEDVTYNTINQPSGGIDVSIKIISGSLAGRNVDVAIRGAVNAEQANKIIDHATQCAHGIADLMFKPTIVSAIPGKK